jgi:tetratricopeptide (TPR) repeat protein
MPMSPSHADAAPELFEQALALHQAGRLEEAAPLYERLKLATRSRDFAVLHMLGVLRAQQGRHGESLELIGAALEIDGGSPPALSNYATTLAALGRWPEALAYSDKALAINPAHPGALKNRADSLLALKRPGEAIESYGKAIAASRHPAEALNGRGNAFGALGRLTEALADYDRAIAMEPRLADAHYNRGFALFALDRHEAAIAAFDKALALRPGDAVALNQRGVALRRLHRWEEAIRSYDAALAAAPGYAQAWNNRGCAYHDMARYQEALTSFETALAYDPANAKTLNNRGTALHRMGRLEAARQSYDAALAIDPDDPETLTNKGVVLRELECQDEALQLFDRAAEVDPQYANAHWNKAVSKLLLGDFDEGWRLYEWRKKLPAPVEARSYGRPLCTDARDVNGKTVFVYAAQGLGDTIQFYRFAGALHDKGAKVVLSVQDTLVRLLATGGGPVRIVGANVLPDRFDCHIPLPSLPLALKCGADVRAGAVPYIHPESARAARWRERIGRNGFRIGIAWQGAAGRDDRRAIPLTAFAPLADIPGVRLISLQKGAGTEQLDAQPRIERLGEAFDEGPDGFIDTAAIIHGLDLVITLDSAIAHLAGALGCPVWVALRRVPDWRWLLRRADSPWYPTMRLFRQHTDGDWSHPFSQIAAALDQLTNRVR